MKVYVAYYYETYGVDPGGDVVGVYSSKEKAVERLKEVSKWERNPEEYTYLVMVYVVDDPYAETDGEGCEVDIM